MKHLFQLKLKYEKGESDFMVDVIKLYLNSLYGKTIRRNIDKEYIIRSENWLMKNNDDRVVVNEPLQNRENAIKYSETPELKKQRKLKMYPISIRFFRCIT